MTATLRRAPPTAADQHLLVSEVAHVPPLAIARRNMVRFGCTAAALIGTTILAVAHLHGVERASLELTSRDSSSLRHHASAAKKRGRRRRGLRHPNANSLLSGKSPMQQQQQQQQHNGSDFLLRHIDKDSESGKPPMQQQQQQQQHNRSDFLLRHIDTDSKVLCGWSKCVYRDKANSSLGYEMSLSSGDDPLRIMDVYKFVMDLERETGIRHAYRGPPKLLQLDWNDVEIYLLPNRMHASKESKVSEESEPCRFFPGCRQNGTAHSHLLVHVQPVLYVDTSSSVVLKRLGSLRRTNRERLGDMLVRAYQHKAVDLELLRTNIQRHVNIAKKMLKSQPCLRKDFQLLAHSDGSITHIDLDRCLDEKERPMKYDLFLDDLESWYMDSNWTMVEKISSREKDFSPKIIKATDKIKCGGNKCFFESLLNNDTGYLATPSIRPYHPLQTEEAWFDTLQASWDLEMQLEAKYGIMHFALEPPRKVVIPKEIADMNAKLWRDDRQAYVRELEFSVAKEKTPVQFHLGSTAYMQKMRKAPKSSILIGCSKRKSKQLRDKILRFSSLIGDKLRFSRAFKINLDKAREMIKKETCLIQDFQVIVDAEGRIYHFDFDRCFDPYDATKKRQWSLEKQTSCFSLLGEIEAFFLENSTGLT